MHWVAQRRVEPALRLIGIMQPSLCIEVSSASEPTLNLLAVGDFCVRTPPAKRALAEQPGQIYSAEVLDTCNDKDVSMVNLECPLSEAGSPILKSGPAIRGCPEIVDALRTAKFDVAVMANNHILDHGAEAMFATREMCQKAGLQTLGVGANLEEAERPLVIEVNGLKLGLLAFAEQEFSCATSVSPGAARLDPVLAGRVVRQTKDQADLVVVNVHGGNEFHFAPSPRMQLWYRFLVDCGADAVIGHHPHTVQGVEVYKGAPILYSLGNFVFDSSGLLPPCWYVGLIAKLRLGAGGVHRVELCPTVQSQNGGAPHVALLKGDAAEQFAARLQRLNEIAGDQAMVRELWECFCYDQRAGYCGRLLAGAGVTPARLSGLVKGGIKYVAPHYLGAALSGALGRYATGKKTRQAVLAQLCNLLRCPAHHELMTTALEMELGQQRPDPKVWAEYEELIRACR